MKITFGQATTIPVIVLALSACEEGLGQDRFASPEAATATGAARTEIRDVEAPEVFSRTELGLWDGRPSLGGIWVAHPDVDTPERAIIRNMTTGESVPGALFRRERNNPGPSFQISSEAAATLSILAGQPTEISVVAVRQEEIVIEPALPLSDEVPGEDLDAPVAEDDTLEATVPEDADVAADGDDDASAAVAVGATAAVVAADQAPKKPGFWQRFRDSLRNKPKPAADIALEADTATLEATTDSAAAPDVDTQTLAPVTAVAAAAIAEAEADAAPPARPAGNVLKNPYVQVGLFSVEANASSAATSLRQAGIVPTVLPHRAQGREMWRVVVGPMTTTADQAEILSQVKALGYADAFLAPS